MVPTLEHFTNGEWADRGELAVGAAVLADGAGSVAIGGLDGVFHFGVSAIGAGKSPIGGNATACDGTTRE